MTIQQHMTPPISAHEHHYVNHTNLICQGIMSAHVSVTCQEIASHLSDLWSLAHRLVRNGNYFDWSMCIVVTCDRIRFCCVRARVTQLTVKCFFFPFHASEKIRKLCGHTRFCLWHYLLYLLPCISWTISIIFMEDGKLFNTSKQSTFLESFFL